MEVSDDLPHCVGRLEIASPKPVGFLCGTLPVIADANSFSLPRSALVPSTSQRMAAPRYQMLPTETDLNSLPLLHNIPEKVLPPSDKAGWNLQEQRTELGSLYQAYRPENMAILLSTFMKSL